MRHARFGSTLASSLVLLLAACAAPAGEGPAPGLEVASDLSRELEPQVAAEDRAALVAGNTAFAVDLYQAVRGQPGNRFASPFSASLALAMTWAGARSDTEAQMASALHFDLPQDRLHPAFNWLDLELARRDELPEGTKGEGFQLSIANRLFGQVGYGFLPEFLDTLAVNYGAGMQLLDFGADPEGCRKDINGWVAACTVDRIPELLPAGSISDVTRLVLVNAVYFKASWARPFDADDTAPGAFRLADGTSVTVPTLHGTAGDRYAEGDGWQAAALPYVGQALDMVLIVPDDLAAFEAGFDAARLTGILSGLREASVTVSLPRFSFRDRMRMKEALLALGMVDAFGGRADFSGMDGTRTLFVSDVFHEAFVAVDEKGTEAAAATAVVMDRVSAPEPATLAADRPFLFLVRDRPTGAVLFLGRVADPRPHGV